jgi:hypothetical protein
MWPLRPASLSGAWPACPLGFSFFAAAMVFRAGLSAGLAVSWDFARRHSKLDLTTPKYALEEMEVAPVAMPSVTELI